MTKNIAIICNLSKGGAERVAGAVSKNLSKKYNVFFFLINNYEISYDYGGKMIDLGFEQIYNKWKKRKGGYFLRFFAYEELRRLIKRKKRELKIDIAISFLETPNILNILSRTNEKVIISVRNMLSLGMTSMIRRFEIIGARLFYKQADKIIAVSDGVKSDLIKNFKLTDSIITTIYNPVDLSSIELKKGEPSKYDDLFKKYDVIINIGRLHFQKNQKRFISDFANAAKQNNSIRCMIIGSGELQRELEDFAKSLNVLNLIDFVPYTENPYSLLSRAKVFVLSSEFEGLSNVIIEAMACKVPVVATDCPSGSRELLTDNANANYENTILKNTVCTRGILVPIEKNDQIGHSISDAVLTLLNNEQLYRTLSENAYKYIKNYDNDEIFNHWERIVNEE